MGRNILKNINNNILKNVNNEVLTHDKLGPNLFTNWRFDTDTTGWGGDPENFHWSSKYGGCVMFDRVNSDFARLQQNVGIEQGKRYRQSCYVYETTQLIYYYDGAYKIFPGSVIGYTGPLTVDFTRTNTNTWAYFRIAGNAGDYAYLDNCKIQEILD